MKVSELVVRQTDGWGSGAFNASRGNRRHKGIDFLCYPFICIHSHIAGKVTKLGICYADDHSYRYVEITDASGLRHRTFYLYPGVKLHSKVNAGDVIGTSQDIQRRYRDRDVCKVMSQHIHYEVLDTNGNPLNPATFL